MKTICHNHRKPVKGFAVLLMLLCFLFVPFKGNQIYADSGEDNQSLEKSIDSGPSLAEMEKGGGWSYNGEYIYALSRSVRDSGLPEAAKVPLFIPALIIDTGLLPIALIAGLLG